MGIFDGVFDEDEEKRRKPSQRAAEFNKRDAASKDDSIFGGIFDGVAEPSPYVPPPPPPPPKTFGEKARDFGVEVSKGFDKGTQIAKDFAGKTKTFLFGEPAKPKFVSPQRIIPEKPAHVQLSDEEYQAHVTKVMDYRAETWEEVKAKELEIQSWLIDNSEFGYIKLAQSNPELFERYKQKSTAGTGSYKVPHDAGWGLSNKKSKEFQNKIRELKALRIAVDDYDTFLGNEPARRGLLGRAWALLSDQSTQAETLVPFERGRYNDFVFTKQREAIEKYQAGEELNRDEQRMLHSFRAAAYNNYIDKGIADQAGEVLADIPRYAFEVYATSGVVSPATTGASQAIAKSSAPAIVKTIAPKIINNSVKLALASNLNIPGIKGAQAQYMLPTVDYEAQLGEEDILTLLKPGDDSGDALRKAYLTNMVEYVSEGVGGYIDDAAPFVKKAFVGKWLSELSDQTPGAIRSALSKANFNSLVGEVLEEEIGEPLQALIEERSYFNPLTPEGRERVLVEILGIGAFSGMSNVSDSVIREAVKRRNKNGDYIDLPVDPKAEAEARTSETKVDEGKSQNAADQVPQSVPQVVADAVVEAGEKRGETKVAPLKAKDQRTAAQVEVDSGWKPGAKSQFDAALLTKDAETVAKMLPEVPSEYQTRFSKKIKEILGEDFDLEGVKKEAPKKKVSRKVELNKKKTTDKDGTQFFDVKEGSKVVGEVEVQEGTFGENDVYVHYVETAEGSRRQGVALDALKQIARQNKGKTISAEPSHQAILKLLQKAFGDPIDISDADSDITFEEALALLPEDAVFLENGDLDTSKRVFVRFQNPEAKVTTPSGTATTGGFADTDSAISQQIADIQKVIDNPDTSDAVKVALQKELELLNAKADAVISTKDVKAEDGGIPRRGRAEFAGRVGGLAEKGGFSDVESAQKTVSKIQAVEFPEVLAIAKELLGKTPQVRALRGKLGVFKGAEGLEGQIYLNPEIFKDPSLAGKVLAHEVGHLIDFIPQGTTKRGNLIARLTSLRKHMRNAFTGFESEIEIDNLNQAKTPLQEEKRAIRNTPVEERTAEQTARLKALDSQIRGINQDLKKLKAKPILENKAVTKELKELTQLWKPFDENLNDNFTRYRYSAVELYADAMSVLFNDPALLKQKAPNFWAGFFDYVDQKPQVKKELFETWDLLNLGEEAVFNKRDQAMNDAFQRGEEVFAAKELERKKRKSSLMYQMRLLFDDTNIPIIEKINRLKKKGVKLNPDANPLYALKGLNYLDGKLKNYVNRNFQPVFAKAQQVPDGWNQLGKVLQLERAINERGELANPQGFNPKTAKTQLEGLEKNMSPADWKQIQEAKDLFRQAVQESVDRAEKAGFYTPEMIEQMKMNPSYATFQVVDYIDTFISPRVYHSIGTLKDIANPATSTVMKLVSVFKAIERNDAKRVNIEFLQKHFPESIQPAKSRWNGRTMEIRDTREKGQGLVVITEKGRPKGFYVEQDVADTMNYVDNKTIRAAGKISQIISGSKIYKPLFTTFNVGFQTFNFVRDFYRYWKNVPDFTFKDALTSAPRAAFRYAQAVPHAANRVLNNKDTLIQEMEDAKILGLTFNQMFFQQFENERSQIERVLVNSGVLARKKKRGIFTPLEAVLGAIGDMGDFIETLPKVAGYIELKGKMPQKQLAQFIRTSVGSPDFRTGGTFTPVSNNIFLFSNAIKEGLKADAEVAFTSNPSRAGFWWKTVMGTFLPKFLMAGMVAGLFGDELKELLRKVSEYDKTNYHIIPLGFNEDGKAIYLRIPQDETGRFLGGLLWKIMNLNKEDKSINDVFQLFSFGAGQFPTLAPSFTGAGAVMTYMSGRNPYDTFRGRHIIPQTQFEAGPKESLPVLLDWLVKNQGLGIFYPSYQAEKDATTLEKTINAPVLSNILGRWVKVSDFGEVEELRKVSESETKRRAKARLTERQAVDRAVKKFKESNGSIRARRKIERELVREIVGKGPYKNERKTKATALVKKFRITHLRGQRDPQLNSLIDARSNGEKVLLLLELERTMSPGEFKELFDVAKKNKIISSNVVKDYKRARRGLR